MSVILAFFRTPPFCVVAGGVCFNATVPSHLYIYKSVGTNLFLPYVGMDFEGIHTNFGAPLSKGGATRSYLVGAKSVPGSGSRS